MNHIPEFHNYSLSKDALRTYGLTRRNDKKEQILDLPKNGFVADKNGLVLQLPFQNVQIPHPELSLRDIAKRLSDGEYLNLRGTNIRLTEWPRESNSKVIGLDLRGSKIGGLSNTKIDLRYVDLRGADLNQVWANNGLILDGAILDQNTNFINPNPGWFPPGSSHQAEAACLHYSSLKDIDFSGVNLDHVNCSSSDFRGSRFNEQSTLRRTSLDFANCQGVDFNGADCQEASMYQANLSGANLSRANLRGAGLSEADLQGANLYGADLGDANLQSTDLTNKDLSETNLRGANLQWATLQPRVVHDDKYDSFVRFSGDRDVYKESEENIPSSTVLPLDLQDVKFYGVNLSRFDLSEHRLQGANFQNANLTETSIRENADLTNVIFAGTSGLSGRDFSRNTLVGNDFTGTDLQNCIFGGNLENISFQDADLRGADLSNASLKNVNLLGANLEGAKLPEGYTSATETEMLKGALTRESTDRGMGVNDVQILSNNPLQVVNYIADGHKASSTKAIDIAKIIVSYTPEEMSAEFEGLRQRAFQNLLEAHPSEIFEYYNRTFVRVFCEKRRDPNDVVTIEEGFIRMFGEDTSSAAVQRRQFEDLNKRRFMSTLAEAAFNHPECKEAREYLKQIVIHYIMYANEDTVNMRDFHSDMYGGSQPMGILLTIFGQGKRLPSGADFQIALRALSSLSESDSERFWSALSFFSGNQSTYLNSVNLIINDPQIIRNLPQTLSDYETGIQSGRYSPYDEIIYVTKTCLNTLASVSRGYSEVYLQSLSPETNDLIKESLLHCKQKMATWLSYPPREARDLESLGLLVDLCEDMKTDTELMRLMEQSKELNMEAFRQAQETLRKRLYPDGD